MQITIIWAPFHSLILRCRHPDVLPTSKSPGKNSRETLQIFNHDELLLTETFFFCFLQTRSGHTGEQTGEESERHGKHENSSDDKKMSQQIAIMKPILRFLQLLCENHNRDLQVGSEQFQPSHKN